MKQVAVLLLAVAAVIAEEPNKCPVVVPSELEKVSSSVIRNGTQIYSFFTPERTTTVKVNIVFRAFPAATSYYVLPELEPQWVAPNNYLDANPDVNVIGDNQIRVYFVATTGNRGTGIGVAMSDTLAAAGNRFVSLPSPIIQSVNGETLSHPSLYKASNGSLYLYYYNSTAATYGNFVNVQLSADGLRLNAPSTLTSVLGVKAGGKSLLNILSSRRTSEQADKTL